MRTVRFSFDFIELGRLLSGKQQKPKSNRPHLKGEFIAYNEKVFGQSQVKSVSCHLSVLFLVLTYFSETLSPYSDKDGDKPIKADSLSPQQPHQKRITCFPKVQAEVSGQTLTGPRTHALLPTHHWDTG